MTENECIDNLQHFYQNIQNSIYIWVMACYISVMVGHNIMAFENHLKMMVILTIAKC